MFIEQYIEEMYQKPVKALSADQIIQAIQKLDFENHLKDKAQNSLANRTDVQVTVDFLGDIKTFTLTEKAYREFVNKMKQTL